jgi:HK97 family phage portal protein
MNLLPAPLRRMLPSSRKAANLAQPVSSLATTTGFFGRIMESFAGAWQKNVEVDNCQGLLAFSAVYACISMIAGDIAKLRIKLTQKRGDGTWEEFDNTAWTPVLRKPNRYQTRIQFLSEWITTKLLYGNAYILKERDARRVVVAMYVLDPRRVQPMVTPDGDVYYEVKADYLAGIQEADALTLIPADDIIHDRAMTLFHPLVGVSPIYACGSSATQGKRIQANSAAFFENMSRPSLIITTPKIIPEAEMLKLKGQSETGFSGANLGRLMILGGGMDAKQMTIPASDAQLIEQLRWTVEDVARCFKVPLHKISSANAPSFNNIGALNQDYYSQTLQEFIESIEILLDEGLGLPPGVGTELDIDQLLRMDPVARADANAKRLGSGELAPNEARMRENLPPVKGGEKPFMQQQMFPIDALANRPPPAALAAPAPTATNPANPPTPQDAPTPPTPNGDQAAKDLALVLIRRAQTAVFDAA